MPTILEIQAALSRQAEQEYKQQEERWLQMTPAELLERSGDIFISQKVKDFLTSEIPDYYAAQLYLMDNPYKQLARDLELLLDTDDEHIAGNHMDRFLVHATEHDPEEILRKFNTVSEYESMIGGSICDIIL